MNTQSNTTQSEQSTPSIRDLIGFDLPRLTRHFTETSIGYSIDCDDKELNRLKSAAIVSSQIMRDGNDAIIDLLLTIDLHCPNEANRFSRINALALIFELSGVLRGIDDMEWTLDRAQAGLDDVTESAEKKA